MEETKRGRLTAERLAVLRDIRDAMAAEGTEVHLVSGMDATVPDWVKKTLSGLLTELLRERPAGLPGGSLERRIGDGGTVWRVRADVRGGGVTVERDGVAVAAADLGRCCGELEETARGLILRRLLGSAVVF